MHSLSFLACLVASLATGANSALIKVQVGKNSTGQLDTVFNPNQVTAQVGDTIQFEFMAKNHTATQSSFANPCTRQFNTVLNLAGADSGFMPVAANATEIPTWTIQVNDASSPQWFFCNQAEHCNLGMVFAINAPTTGNKTFDAFVTAAMTANHPDPALNQTAPFTPPGASSSPSTPTTDDTGSSPTDSPATPTDAPANVAPDVSSSDGYSSDNSTAVTSGALGLSYDTGAAGTGTAAQDVVSGTSTGTALPVSTSTRSAASRLTVGGGGVKLAVLLCVVLGALVL